MEIGAMTGSRTYRAAARGSLLMLIAWSSALSLSEAAAPDAPAESVRNQQAADGVVILPAKTADVHGKMLRYEPEPHKNTLGYWTRADDWASWDFEVTRPGEFALHGLVGCGNGSGGSEVEFAVGEQRLRMTVKETGGFQNFVDRKLGTIKLDRPGHFTLTVKVLAKPSNAVMDLREVTLKPVAAL
jgi:arylsulfatase A